MRRLCTVVLSMLALGCTENGPSPTATEDGGIPVLPEADGGGGAVDAVVISRGDGGRHPGSDLGPPFVNDLPPYPACPSGNAFKPERGYSGGVGGQKKCGPESPNCPTSYVPGNSGAPCTQASDCTGKDPVC